MKSISFALVTVLLLAATPGLAATTPDDVLTDAQLTQKKQLDKSKKLDELHANQHRLPADDVVRLYEEVLKDQSHGGIMAASIKNKSGPALANAINRLSTASLEDINHKTANGKSAMDVLNTLADPALKNKDKFTASLKPAKDMLAAIGIEKSAPGTGKVKFADSFKADPKTALLSQAVSKLPTIQKIQVTIDKEDSLSSVNPEQLGIDRGTYSQAYRAYISAVRSAEDKALTLDKTDPKAVLDLADDYDAADKAHQALRKLVDVAK